MQEELIELFSILNKWNKIFDNKVILQNEIEEEKENIKDYIAKKIELKKLLKELNESPLNNWEKNTEYLLNLHLVLGHFTWYFDNLNDLIIRLLQKNSERKNRK